MERYSQILDHHGLDESSFLGQGIEARVYKLNETQILRIVHQDELSSLEARSDLCAQIAENNFSFATPEVLSIEEIEGAFYTIETRFTGQVMTDYLGAANANDRRIMWRNCLEAVAEISKVELPESQYGDLVARNPTRADTWSEYLLRRVTDETSRSADLSEDLEDWQRRIAELVVRIGEIPAAGKHLVHGDVYPNNVFMDERATVTAICDFSALTVVGDPLMDVTATLYFPEIFGQITKAETAELEHYVASQFGENALRTVETYKLYYSAIFVGGKQFDLATYEWSIKNLAVL